LAPRDNRKPALAGGRFKTNAHSGDDIEYEVQPDDSGPTERWYKDVWSIRTRLQVEERTEELAMFNLTIDSKLRGCDVLSQKVEDVAPHA
jgi:hypothetical protein